MLLDRPVATVPGCQNVAPRFATADRDARGDARAHDRVEQVWRHGLEGPASTACTQDGAMAELVSHGIAARAGRASKVDPTKPACLLPAVTAVVGLEPIGGHAVHRFRAGDGERRATAQDRDRPGQARVASFEEVTEITDRITDGRGRTTHPDQRVGGA